MLNRCKILLAVTFVMAFIGTAFFLSGVGLGGELEPPNTVPTMPTLEYIYQEVKNQLVSWPFVIWDDNKRFAIYENKTPDDLSDDIVLDRATNLMWTRNANIAGVSMPHPDAVSYCNNLVLCGKDDWRLPTIEELVSLTEAYPSPRKPALPSGHPFVNVKTSYYWSSTSPSINFLWIVSMYNGEAEQSNYWTDSYVWPVRGGQ